MICLADHTCSGSHYLARMTSKTAHMTHMTSKTKVTREVRAMAALQCHIKITEKMRTFDNRLFPYTETDNVITL